MPFDSYVTLEARPVVPLLTNSGQIDYMEQLRRSVEQLRRQTASSASTSSGLSSASSVSPSLMASAKSSNGDCLVVYEPHLVSSGADAAAPPGGFRLKQTPPSGGHRSESSSGASSSSSWQTSARRDVIYDDVDNDIDDGYEDIDGDASFDVLEDSGVDLQYPRARLFTGRADESTAGRTRDFSDSNDVHINYPSTKISSPPGRGVRTIVGNIPGTTDLNTQNLHYHGDRPGHSHIEPKGTSTTNQKEPSSEHTESGHVWQFPGLCLTAAQRPHVENTCPVPNTKPVELTRPRRAKTYIQQTLEKQRQRAKETSDVLNQGCPTGTMLNPPSKVRSQDRVNKRTDATVQTQAINTDLSGFPGCRLREIPAARSNLHRRSQVMYEDENVVVEQSPDPTAPSPPSPRLLAEGVYMDMNKTRAYVTKSCQTDRSVFRRAVKERTEGDGSPASETDGAIGHKDNQPTNDSIPHHMPQSPGRTLTNKNQPYHHDGDHNNNQGLLRRTEALNSRGRAPGGTDVNVSEERPPNPYTGEGTVAMSAPNIAAAPFDHYRSPSVTSFMSVTSLEVAAIMAGEEDEGSPEDGRAGASWRSAVKLEKERLRLQHQRLESYQSNFVGETGDEAEAVYELMDGRRATGDYHDADGGYHDNIELLKREKILRSVLDNLAAGPTAGGGGRRGLHSFVTQSLASFFTAPDRLQAPITHGGNHQPGPDASAKPKQGSPGGEKGGDLPSLCQLTSTFRLFHVTYGDYHDLEHVRLASVEVCLLESRQNLMTASAQPGSQRSSAVKSQSTSSSSSSSSSSPSSSCSSTQGPRYGSYSPSRVHRFPVISVLGHPRLELDHGGIQVGDHIVEVNDVCMMDRSPDVFYEVLRHSAVVNLVIGRRRSRRETNQKHWCDSAML